MQGGLPDRFTEDTAALLAFLDRQNVRYDVTTDLALPFVTFDADPAA